eukprot:139037-Pelagomonas_calceolata.AAC.1
MTRTQSHARKGVGSSWRGGKGANKSKPSGLWHFKVLSWIVKSKRQFVDLQDSCGCLAGHACL